MNKRQRKPYSAPVVKRYGAVEEITKSIRRPGSGDILTMLETSCPEGGPLSLYCTGS